MKEYIELPVNKEGFMRAGTMQAALYAILTSKEYAGELNAVISRFRILSGGREFDYLKEAETFTRQFKNVILDLDSRHRELRFSSHPYTENKYAYLYKEISEGVSYYSIEVRAEYIQDTDAWSCMKLVFSNGIWNYNEKSGKAYFENEHTVKLTSQGRLFFHSSKSEEDIRIFKFKKNQPVFLKLEFQSPNILVKYSDDGICWITLHEEVSSGLECNEAGLFIEPKINTFFYDFFISNIQLFFHKEEKRIMTFPPFAHKERYFSELFESYSMPYELFFYKDMEYIEGLMQFIDNACYIYMKSEKTSGMENKEFRHRRILYGYDRKRRIFKQITLEGDLQFSELSFDNFLRVYQSENNLEGIITLYQYKSWRYPKSFDVDSVVSCLKTYLNGSGSFAVTSRKKIVYFTEKPFVCGLKILDEILTKEVYMDAILADTELSGRIHEHYRIMLKMLEFIKHIKIISEKDCHMHTEGFKNLIRISAQIKYLVLQNEMNRTENIKEKMSLLLKKLKQVDKCETEKLIQSLQRIHRTDNRE